MKPILSIAFVTITLFSAAQCDPIPIFANDTTHAVCFEEVANTRRIYTNNIPDHAYGPFAGPNNIQGQDFEYNMCLYPTLNSVSTPLTEDTTSQGCGGGIVFGISHQGVLYSPFARLYWVNPNTQQENLDFEIEAEYTLTMDLNGGHVNNLSRYHYHNVPIDYLTNDLGIDGNSHSPLLGYAADGFPIYYKYLYTDPMDAFSGITGFQSDYELLVGTRPGDGITAPNGVYDGTYIQDYQQIPNQSELDECGGRYGVTPEYPDGTYYYVLTDNWPYIPRCLKGLFIDNSFKIGPNCPASTATLDCSTESTMKIEILKDEIGLNFFPNPTQNILQVEVKEQYKERITAISIYNTKGKQAVLAGSYKESIDVTHLVSGIYFVQINFGDDQVTKKLIIK
ncbi:MAG: YHYH protein [Crocinitomicaceae bacterium]|nr:YHYH protein [Crocinitomicaceae bacterium]